MAHKVSGLDEAGFEVLADNTPSGVRSRCCRQPLKGSLCSDVFKCAFQSGFYLLVLIENLFHSLKIRVYLACFAFKYCGVFLKR